MRKHTGRTALLRGSADFQSDVSPICNRQALFFLSRARKCHAPAECNSAIQQIENLRYEHRTRVLFSLVCLTSLVAGFARGTPALPVIPNQIFYVTNYGAVGDGVTTNTTAIQNTINAAASSALHGGTVEMTPGIFLSGPLILSSSINLQLDSGATLQMLPYGQYPGGSSPPNFINGSSLHDIEISGPGTIDGQGAAWWPNYKSISRPYMVNLSACTRVLVQNVTLQNAPAQNLAVKGRAGNVTIQGITVNAPSSSDPLNPSHNTDAIDLAETNCLIQNCNLSVGDDNVAVGSSGSVSSDILITNCACGNGHGISIGSNTSDGVSNMTVINCTFNGTDNGIRMKSDNDRGGLVQNISYLNIGMTNVTFPIVIYSYYNQVGTPNNISPATAAGEAVAPVTSTTPIWRNITISNLTASAASLGIAGIIWGRTELPVTNITLAKINLTAPKTFDLYNVRGMQAVDANLSLSGSAKTFTLYNTGLTLSNSVPITGLVTLDGLAASNTLALYSASAALSDATALGANPMTLSGGTLTISNDLNLTPSEAMTFELGSSAATIVVKSNLVLNGAINISAGGGFGNGDYTIFSYGGGLSWGQVSFGSVPAGYTYALDTNSAGQVKVLVRSMTSLSPLNLVWQKQSGQLALSWPADHIGWELQLQTNANAAGLGTNWLSVPGSRQTNEMFLPFDTGNGSVYLRLAYP